MKKTILFIAFATTYIYLSAQGVIVVSPDPQLNGICPNKPKTYNLSNAACYNLQNITIKDGAVQGGNPQIAYGFSAFASVGACTGCSDAGKSDQC